jgi:NADPH2:quinone reductase
MAPYSIQWLLRFKPAWFRHDLLTLLDLLKQGKIKPLIAQRLPLEAARRAHEMLGDGGVLGKIVLLPNGSRNMARSRRASFSALVCPDALPNATDCVTLRCHF